MGISLEASYVDESNSKDVAAFTKLRRSRPNLYFIVTGIKEMACLDNIHVEVPSRQALADVAIRLTIGESEPPKSFASMDFGDMNERSIENASCSQ